MDDLITKLQSDAGLTPEQAQKSLEVIMNFVKEKFPMFGGAVDNLFAGSGTKDEGYLD